MSGSVAVEPDPAYPAGYAVIRVHGAARFRGATDFRIKRDDYDESVFGPKGWQVADELLAPDDQSVDGDDLLLHIGPSIVQQVVSGVYHVAVPAAAVDTTVFWPDLPLLADDASNMVAEPARGAPRAASPLRPQIQRQTPEGPLNRTGPGVPATQPDPVGTPGKIEPARDETVRLTPPARKLSEQPPPPEPEPRRWLPWAVLLLVVLIAGGGGYLGYRWLYPPTSPVADQNPGGNPPAKAWHPPPPAQVPPQPDLEHMSAAAALQSGAPPEALLREAERRMQLDGVQQRGDALLLMQGAADPSRNYAPAHAALGRLYDPGLSHPADIKPDARQAAIHYRSAVQGGDNSVVDARAALKAYLEQQSQRGDLYAPLILKEFWP